MWDPRYQYALHITSYKEQPVSDKMLSRFCKRCYDHDSVYGVELLHDSIADLIDKIAKMMDISPRIMIPSPKAKESVSHFETRKKNCESANTKVFPTKQRE